MGRYSEDDITNIIKMNDANISSSRRDELSLRLEQAAERRFTQRTVNQEPTAKMVGDRFNKIEKAAEKLLSEIGVGPGGSLRTVPGHVLSRFQLMANKKAVNFDMPAVNLFRETVASVVQIRRWSKQQVRIENEREKRRLGSSGVANPRRSKSTALRYWVLELSDIYSDFFDRKHTKPTVTWDAYDEQPKGNFFNFIRCSAIPLGEKQSDVALAKDIQKASKLRKDA